MKKFIRDEIRKLEVQLKDTERHQRKAEQEAFRLRDQIEFLQRTAESPEAMTRAAIAMWNRGITEWVP